MYLHHCCDPLSQRFRGVTARKRVLSGYGRIGCGRSKASVSDHASFLMTLVCDHPRALLSNHLRIPFTLKHWLLSETTVKQGHHRGECGNLQQKQKAVTYAAEEPEFYTYPPPESVRLLRSQTAPVCRGAGWPPAALAFLTVDMCITPFIFSALTDS